MVNGLIVLLMAEFLISMANQPWAEAAHVVRLITGSRLVGGTSAFNTTYGTFIPGDDGSITGEITKIDGNKVSLKVAVCRQVKLKMVALKQLQLQLMIMLNITSMVNAIVQKNIAKVGNHIRVLEAIPHGAAISRDTDDAKWLLLRWLYNLSDRSINPCIS